MSSRSRSTGFSERSSTVYPTPEAPSSWSGLDLRLLNFTVRYKNQSGTVRTKSRPGLTSHSLRYWSSPSLQTTGLFSHPGPTGHQYHLEQDARWNQGQMDSTPGTQARL